MAEKPNIVSILTLDRLDLTRKAVNSVLEKSIENTKIVFFDNGSKDGTLEYLAQLKKEYPQKVDYLRSETNIGVAGGRNRIYRHVISNYGSNFSWIFNLDNDCIAHDKYDAAITHCIQETGAHAVCPRLIQPDGRIFHNAHNGFLINLQNMELKLEYGDNVNIPYTDSKVSQRIETDVILGTSAKTPEFFDRVGFYDENHKIGWEDYSIALRAFGLNKKDFLKWKEENRNKGKEWMPLKELMNGDKEKKALVVYEPSCMITHNHPVTEEHEAYEKIRWKAETIQESTEHFQKVWGIKPVM